MKRTVSIKLNPTTEQSKALEELRNSFNAACNLIVPYAVENRCWNRVALHHLCYYQVRETSELGSQMVCNAIHKVCSAYKVLGLKKKDDVPVIGFKDKSSVHFDKRTYTIKDGGISLYTLNKRILVSCQIGDFQKAYLKKGVAKEAELIRKRNTWYFNLVLDLPNPAKTEPNGKVLGIDMGESNLATTSNGTIHGGGSLRHQRDKYLALRKRLQSNGTQSSKQLLKKVSGKESRHVKHVNHVVSRLIVNEAIASDCDTIALENLTNIRQRIKANKRVRSRLHRWSWYQLQQFIEYKAEEAGLNVVYVNPAYTSQTCSVCSSIGQRSKHRFYCSNCGSQQHSDLNASRNICRLVESADSSTGQVTAPYVRLAS